MKITQLIQEMRVKKSLHKRLEDSQEIWENMIPIKMEKVTKDIDGTVVYEVPVKPSKKWKNIREVDLGGEVCEPNGQATLLLTGY